jgi:pimeloyl-ACP methyl ester carboxylesterase
VIVLDGYGSRLMGQLVAERADDNGVRVIAPDRPGYWMSDQRPGSPMVSWPAACEELLDHLAIDESAVLGSSAGCPMTFATSATLDSRISRVAIVGPISPFADAGDMSDMDSAQRRTFQLAARWPRFGAASMRMMGALGRVAPRLVLRVVARQRPAVDAQRMGEESLRNLMLESVPGLMGRAASGDLRALAGDWRDVVDATTQSVRIWVGSVDSVHPKSMDDALSARLADTRTTMVDGGFFDCTDQLDEILRWVAGRAD